MRSAFLEIIVVEPLGLGLVVTDCDRSLGAHGFRCALFLFSFQRTELTNLNYIYTYIWLTANLSRAGSARRKSEASSRKCLRSFVWRCFFPRGRLRVRFCDCSLSSRLRDGSAVCNVFVFPYGPKSPMSPMLKLGREDRRNVVHRTFSR